MTRAAWQVDPDDPRAPSVAVWAALTASERQRVETSLPSEIPRTSPPEGDRHRVPKSRALEALGEFFRRIGRRIYLSSELPVYYPDERVFAPDLIAVLDVDPHERDRWLVSKEGQGLDFVFEVTLGGDAQKDLEVNVGRYARLGIPEYFVLDARTSRLVGYRLDRALQTYRPIVPQHGRWESVVLGLDLALEKGRVRFYRGSAPLLEAAELIVRLEAMTDDLVTGKEEAERLRETAERRREEAEALREQAETSKSETERRAERLAARLKELGVNPDEV